jgi:hypothetical protein
MVEDQKHGVLRPRLQEVTVDKGRAPRLAPLQFGARSTHTLLTPGFWLLTPPLAQLVARRGHHQRGQLTDRMVIERHCV